MIKLGAQEIPINMIFNYLKYFFMISHLSLGFFNIKLCFCFFHNSLLLFTCSLQMCDVALFMGLIFIILLLISWIDVGGHLKVINLKQRLPL